jgi:hypothetical protein
VKSSRIFLLRSSLRFCRALPSAGFVPQFKSTAKKQKPEANKRKPTAKS